MSRPAKPYLHRGWWVTNVGDQRRKLCREKEGRTAADDAFYRLVGQRPHDESRTFPRLRMDELVALFLDTLKIEKAASTYRTYQRWLIDFSRQHGLRPAVEITRQDALQYRNDIATRNYIPIRLTRGKLGPATEAKLKAQQPKPYKPKTVNHPLIALKRCWNWGIDNEYLPPKNPFARIPMLHSEGRQRVITDDEFRAMMWHSTDALIRQFLLMLRFTSARPGVIRTLTWTTVDWPNHRFVIARHKTSRPQKCRSHECFRFPCASRSFLPCSRPGMDSSRFACWSPLGSLGLRTPSGSEWTAFGIKPDENGEQLVL